MKKALQTIYSEFNGTAIDALTSSELRCFMVAAKALNTKVFVDEYNQVCSATNPTAKELTQ